MAEIRNVMVRNEIKHGILAGILNKLKKINPSVHLSFPGQRILIAVIP